GFCFIDNVGDRIVGDFDFLRRGRDREQNRHHHGRKDPHDIIPLSEEAPKAAAARQGKTPRVKLNIICVRMCDLFGF
ncbi:hypothetical protein, partial [Sphingopyxis sp.]|uniref:hypothetical protein n=1 Tax=Sphingopyxis sp. TaxID=1908224 RepID=UPI002B489600